MPRKCLRVVPCPTVGDVSQIFRQTICEHGQGGEAGGVLDLVLDRLAQFQEKSIRTKKKVKSAMVYPSVIMFVAFAIVALLMMVVVPQFESIFEQMLRGAPCLVLLKWS